jgi:hypothetical protein
MEIKKVLVGFAVVCAMTQSLQAAEAPTREALEKMFVMREAEWAAQDLHSQDRRDGAALGRFHWYGYERRYIFEGTVH